ncbi:MAG: hypothetical protein K2W96_21105, partial [Gemmataceae bacterium]|nr:hypothetical protein [Gemmataceae bacterium]
MSRPLLSLHAPPEGFALESLVATTYEADFGFIEEEWLPVALGVRAPTGRHRAFRPEIEHRLAGCEVSILFDLGGCRDPRRLSRRIDLLPVFPPKLHSKVALLAWSKVGERRLRLLVGSANLTGQGFRENHEVMACLDFGAEDGPPRRLLAEALAHLAGMASSPRLDAQLERLARWRDALPPGVEAERGPWRFVDAEGVARGLAEAWGRETPARIVLVSPFWPEGERPEEPLLRLVRAIGVPRRLELVCRSHPVSGFPVVPPSLPLRLR